MDQEYGECYQPTYCIEYRIFSDYSMASGQDQAVSYKHAQMFRFKPLFSPKRTLPPPDDIGEKLTKDGTIIIIAQFWENPPGAIELPAESAPYQIVKIEKDVHLSSKPAVELYSHVKYFESAVDRR
jgi:hypothetical protein